MFDRTAMPQIAKLAQWNIKEYIQTIIIALLFIGGRNKASDGKQKNPAAFRRMNYCETVIGTLSWGLYLLP